MPTFSTPHPISVTIDIEVGTVRVVASDRDDTVFEVRPTDASHPADLKAAQQTKADYASGELQVRAPKLRTLGLLGKSGSVDVTVEVPTGSQLRGATVDGSFHVTGVVGECRLRTGFGDIHLDRCGPLQLRTGFGAITVGSAAGDVEVSTGSGEIRLRSVDGSAKVKNANGPTTIGEVAGDLQVKSANGDIAVGRAGSGVGARTAHGNVRVDELAGGSSTLKTAFGEIEFGIGADTAARLDVDTSFGRVRNLLEKVVTPEPALRTLDVKAHTAFGDVVIKRA